MKFTRVYRVQKKIIDKFTRVYRVQKKKRLYTGFTDIGKMHLLLQTGKYIIISSFKDLEHKKQTGVTKHNIIVYKESALSKPYNHSEVSGSISQRRKSGGKDYVR